MNEFLFLIHLLVIIILSLGALRFGKEALTVWISLQAIFANLFVLKQIVFLGFQITCGDLFAIGSMLSLNLLQEYFGKELAKKTLWICFGSMVAFVLVSQIHLLYIPSEADHSQHAFQIILSSTVRLLFASVITFIIVQQIDIRIFSFLKKHFPRLPFELRNTSSLILSQTLDTILFTFLGMYGLAAKIGDLILFSLILKIITIFGMSPLSIFSRYFLRKPKESIHKQVEI